MDTSKVIIAIIVILLLGGGAYFYFQNKDGEINDDNKPATQNEVIQGASASPEAMNSDQNASDSGTIGSGVVKEFTVEGSSFKFAPAVMSVSKGDKVKITFKSVGGFHDFVIDDLNVKSKQVGSGATDTVEFTADKVGTFEYYCSVGNHRAMGMKGTLTVK